MDPRTRAGINVSAGWLLALASVATTVGTFLFSLPCFAQESRLIASPSAQAADARIRATLRQPISLDYREKPLTEIVDEISRALEINLRIDTTVLKDAGLEPSELPISFRIQSVTAEAALSAMLSSQHLTWDIVDEGLLITTKEQADSMMTLRVYLVRDLVATHATHSDWDDADPLIDLIIGNVHPQSWSEVGGPGTVDYFSHSGVLVFNQSREVHDQVEQLLATLRKARSLQGLRPAVDTIVTFSPSEPLESLSPIAPARRYSATQSWNRPQLHR
jgi:hypothetical protein